MKKTLLLCFIHGFKGDDNTFGTFPEHLRALVSHGLPKVDVKVIIYPTYDTFGDLAECVSRFRDWLQEKVIDIEVANATPSPTVDPSVRVILVGHSMGGIVAADALLSLTSDKPVEHAAGEPKAGEAEGEGKGEEEKTKGDADVEKNEGEGDVKGGTEINSFMFPYIQGVLAFDTPYLGIAPGVVAHGAEDHYNAASSTLAQISGLTGAVGSLWGGAKANEESKDKKKEPVAALPAPEIPATAPAWQRWGKMAMYAGAVGAVAATGAAAYLKRGEIISGWNWAGSHLEFVGCLMKGEELKKRVAGVITLNKELQVGFANLYTRLGKKAVNKEGSVVGSVIGNQRTFCNMPKKEGGARDFFHEAINDEAQDEVSAHMTMFFPKDNPGYYALSEDAKKLIVEWSTNEWYESSTGDMKDFGIENSEL